MTNITTMKTRPSIQFDAMSGTAGEVTARSTRFGTILSGRARQPGRVTPQQKDMRALFARVGRSFKRLTPVQIDVRLDGETVWLTRQQLADLFNRNYKTISKHINNALKEELEGE